MFGADIGEDMTNFFSGLRVGPEPYVAGAELVHRREALRHQTEALAATTDERRRLEIMRRAVMKDPTITTIPDAPTFTPSENMEDIAPPAEAEATPGLMLPDHLPFGHGRQVQTPAQSETNTQVPIVLPQHLRVVTNDELTSNPELARRINEGVNSGSLYVRRVQNGYEVRNATGRNRQQITSGWQNAAERDAMLNFQRALARYENRTGSWEELERARTALRSAGVEYDPTGRRYFRVRLDTFSDSVPVPEASASTPTTASAAPNASAAPASNGTVGYRNNNPGNIRTVPAVTQWPGYAGTDERGFARFDNINNGRAAIARQLGLYASRGINTVSGIINRWSPNTSAGGDNAPSVVSNYINNVAQALGVQPDQPLNLNDSQVMSRLVSAIESFENGGANGTGQTFMASSPSTDLSPLLDLGMGDNPSGDPYDIAAMNDQRNVVSRLAQIAFQTGNVAQGVQLRTQLAQMDMSIAGAVIERSINQFDITGNPGMLAGVFSAFIDRQRHDGSHSRVQFQRHRQSAPGGVDQYVMFVDGQARTAPMTASEIGTSARATFNAEFRNQLIEIQQENNRILLQGQVERSNTSARLYEENVYRLGQLQVEGAARLAEAVARSRGGTNGRVVDINGESAVIYNTDDGTYIAPLSMEPRESLSGGRQVNDVSIGAPQRVGD